jgi:hypothetical protein
LECIDCSFRGVGLWLYSYNNIVYVYTQYITAG